MSRGLVAVTGATGFLGRHLVRALHDDGWRVRILVRRDPVHPLWDRVEPEVVFGVMEQNASLVRLVRNADAVIHAAGLIKARSVKAFHEGNSEGARCLAEVARSVAPDARVLLVSSLAAREPQLSAYAASKRAGEEAARAVLGERLTVVRPPAIYGPGDLETLPLFKAAARGWPLPVLDASARVALIHVTDAARQIVRLASNPPRGRTCAISDARPDGYSWSEIMRAAAGKPNVRLFRAPRLLLLTAALGSTAVGRLRAHAPMLTIGKAREFLHTDWSIQPVEGCGNGPPPVYSLARGFAQTAEWYRREGWL